MNYSVSSNSTIETQILNNNSQTPFPYGLIIITNSADVSVSPTSSPSIPEMSLLTILTLLLSIPIVLIAIRKNAKQCWALKDRTRTWI